MHALRTPLAGSLLAFTLLAAAAAGGCTSHPTPQAVCDCLNKEADAYLAQHPDLTKAQLESEGNEILSELLGPCKALSDAGEQQLKKESLETQTEVKQQLQTCVDNLRDKLRAAAKDDPAVKAAEGAADDQAAAAEAKADQLVADIEAGKTPALTSTEELGEDEAPAPTGGSVSEADWNEMLANYSAYTTQYATMLRKGSKGDMSAMSEAAGIMAKSQALEQQLKAYAEKASPAQQARFARVQAQAMQTMLRAQQ